MSCRAPLLQPGLLPTAARLVLEHSCPPPHLWPKSLQLHLGSSQQLADQLALGAQLQHCHGVQRVADAAVVVHVQLPPHHLQQGGQQGEEHPHLPGPQLPPVDLLG
jgi:hypothetical protein